MKESIENVLKEVVEDLQQTKVKKEKKAELAGKVAAATAASRKIELAAKVEAMTNKTIEAVAPEVDNRSRKATLAAKVEELTSTTDRKEKKAELSAKVRNVLGEYRVAFALEEEMESACDCCSVITASVSGANDDCLIVCSMPNPKFQGEAPEPQRSKKNEKMSVLQDAMEVARLQLKMDGTELTASAYNETFTEYLSAELAYRGLDITKMVDLDKQARLFNERTQ